MSNRVYIVTPAGAVTGGPELCHQLADALNAAGCPASVVYYPFGRGHEIPRPYRGYDCRPAAADDIEPGATVVLPEVYGDLVGAFPGCRVYFWWLSVNNFHRRACSDGAAAQLADIRRIAERHLYQSEYARLFLAENGLTPAQQLSDRLADCYSRPADTGPRRDLVAYNPAKGLERTELVLRALGRSVRPPQVIALRGMDRDQLRTVLSQTKVYIDFGGHPGKDRLPREAAALGACVVTNRRGAAANDIDVPIPREFKIDDRKPGFERRAAAKVGQILADFSRHSAMFDGYRRTIASESSQFTADVAAAFAPADVFA